MVLSELPPWANGLIGVIVSLTASAVDAIGLNLQRRDHVQNASLPPEQQRHECKRVTWHMGFFLYVGSQVFGSTAALCKLPYFKAFFSDILSLPSASCSRSPWGSKFGLQLSICLSFGRNKSREPRFNWNVPHYPWRYSSRGFW